MPSPRKEFWLLSGIFERTGKGNRRVSSEDRKQGGQIGLCRKPGERWQRCGQGRSSGENEEWLDWGHILEVVPTGFADRGCVACDRKGGIRVTQGVLA